MTVGKHMDIEVFYRLAGEYLFADTAHPHYLNAVAIFYITRSPPNSPQTVHTTPLNFMK